jgi:hypothetical protein
MIAVTFALPAESSGFRASLDNQTRSDRSGITTIAGKIDNRAIEVLHTGVGEKLAESGWQAFCEDRQFDCLISAVRRRA